MSDETTEALIAKAKRTAWRHNRLDRINAQQRAWYAKNKEKMRVYHKTWNKEHAEQVSNKKKAYRAKAETRAKEKEYNKNYFIKNKDRIREARKEYQREYQRKYSHTDICQERLHKYHKSDKYKNAVRVRSRNFYNSDKGRSYRQSPSAKALSRKSKHLRRVRFLNCRHEDYTDWLKELLTLDFFKCYWCSKVLPIKALHIDHVIPISRGGDDIRSNVVESCAFCNMSKHDKLPEEWFPPCGY